MRSTVSAATSNAMSPATRRRYFIRRAQRLMTKNFVEIVKDLIPDSLSNLEKLAGEAVEKKK